jgi:hypothetical protein
VSAPAGSTRWGAWAQAALANTAQPYPHNAAHLTAGPDDRRLPAELHPAFHTSYDWHSDVHMHWLLAALLRRHPESVDADAVIARLDADLTPAALQVEAGYLREAPQFERPYGWGWLLVLAAEIAELSQDAAVAAVRMRARAWSVALRPLVTVVRANILGWISHAYAPVRTGVHDNSAFGLLLISCAAAHLGDAEVRRAVADAARAWFGADHAAPVAYEPGGLDFLSPTLVEAHLMVRVLSAGEITAWLTGFLPEHIDSEASWLRPPVIRDLTDARQGHLIGLAFDRAWHCRVLADAAPGLDDEAVTGLREAARRNQNWADDLLAGGLGFQHAHWLSTFALLAAESAADLVEAGAER